jgi:site-specific recombinase XerD
MDDLPLREAQHRRLLEAFLRHLAALGYAEATQGASRRAARELLWLLEQEGKTVHDADAGDVLELMDHLARRENRVTGGSLAASTLTVFYQGVRRLHRYLWQLEGEAFELPEWKSVKARGRLVVLTKREIKALYDACETDAYGLRDRAMLALYYGCGLRRAEGVGLDVSDVLLERRLVYVREGKGAVERYVPLAEGVALDLKQYLFEARPELIQTNERAVLIGRTGRRLRTLLPRLAKLVDVAAERVPTLKEKPVVLHTLRHTIATHLMQAGMPLEAVQQFLGHRSLESTQIYTHVVGLGDEE